MTRVNRRYSVILADRSSGAVKKFTFRIRPVAALVTIILAISLGAVSYLVLDIQNAIDRLTLNKAQLELENSSYRAVAESPTDEMTSLRASLSNLAMRSETAPHLANAIGQLPKGPRRAAGVSNTKFPDETTQTLVELQTLLDALNITLQTVRQGVAYR